MTREYTVTAWEALVARALVLVVVVGSGWAASVYVRDRADAAAADRAQAQYLSAVARYEVDVEERARCVQLVDSRDRFRAAMLDVYDLIDSVSPDPHVTTLSRAQLAVMAPPMAVEACPDVPPPPTPPEE